MALAKIGKVVGVELQDVIHLYNFLTNTLRWDRDEFKKYSRNKYPWCSSLTCYTVIHPKFILLPRYTYSHLPYGIMELMRKRVLDIKFADKIEPKYFTTYDIYRLEPSEDPCDSVSLLEIELRFRPSEDKEKVELEVVNTGVVWYEDKEGYEDKMVCRGNFFLEFFDCREWLVNLKKGVEALSMVIGEDYSKYRREEFCLHKNKVSKGAEDVEYTLLNFLNLTYTLYTEEFDKNIPEYKLFEPVIKMLKEFGDTFDKVINSVRAFSHIID
jgi:hypothetical protein